MASAFTANRSTNRRKKPYAHERLRAGGGAITLMLSLGSPAPIAVAAVPALLPVAGEQTASARNESGVADMSTRRPALSLLQAVQLARLQEPTYQAAKASVMAAEARLKQAYGGLLPQVSVSYNSGSSDRKYVTRQSTIAPAYDIYSTNGAQLNITTPIVRLSNNVAVTQADLSFMQTQHQLRATELELLVRTVTAWVEVMASRDNLVATSSAVAAAKEQMKTNRRGAAIGVKSWPAAEEAQARYEQAGADLVAAESDFQVKIAGLEQLIGPVTESRPPYLAPLFQEPDLDSGSLDGWLAVAETNNSASLAAQMAFETASMEIKKQRAGHLPTADVVANYGRNGQSAGNFPGQNGYAINQWSIGVQVSIPIYSGGVQSAKVDEAIGSREKARAELEAARRSARLNVKQAWFGWRSGAARQIAALQAAKAAQASLQFAEKGVANGLQTDLDLLNTKRDLAMARRDLNKARYEMIVSLIRLKAASGTLDDDDLVWLDAQMSDRDGAVAGIVSKN